MSSRFMLLGGKAWSGDPRLAPDKTLMKAGSPVYNVGGRAVYRHNGDKGSIITWLDKSDVVHKTLVLDAQYRCAFATNSKYWGARATPSGMTEYPNSEYYFTGSSTSPTVVDSNASSHTDGIINSRSGYFEDNHTSNYNTSKIINKWPSSSYAANWCRSNGSGIVADFPNIQTLIRLYLCAKKIDDLDPTAYTYTTSRLSDWMLGFYIWSSTLYNYKCAWYLSGNSQVTYGAQDGGLGVAPTLDL